MNIRLRLACLLIAVLACYFAPAQQTSSSPKVVETHGDVQFVHDPAIIRAGATWYLFSTGNGPERKGEIPIRCSQDLHLWKRWGRSSPKFRNGSRRKVRRPRNYGRRTSPFSTGNITSTTRFQFSARTPQELPCLPTKPWILFNLFPLG